MVSVGLRVGPLSGIEPALLEDAFGLATAGTLAAGARLEVERTTVRLECLECGAQSEARSTNSLTCVSCRSWRIRVLEGEELLLTRVELETTPARSCGRFEPEESFRGA